MIMTAPIVFPILMYTANKRSLTDEETFLYLKDFSFLYFMYYSEKLKSYNLPSFLWICVEDFIHKKTGKKIRKIIEEKLIRRTISSKFLDNKEQKFDLLYTFGADYVKIVFELFRKRDFDDIRIFDITIKKNA